MANKKPAPKSAPNPAPKPAPKPAPVPQSAPAPVKRGRKRLAGDPKRNAQIARAISRLGSAARERLWGEFFPGTPRMADDEMEARLLVTVARSRAALPDYVVLGELRGPRSNLAAKARQVFLAQIHEGPASAVVIVTAIMRECDVDAKRANSLMTGAKRALAKDGIAVVVMYGRA